MTPPDPEPTTESDSRSHPIGYAALRGGLTAALLLALGAVILLFVSRSSSLPWEAIAWAATLPLLLGAVAGAVAAVERAHPRGERSGALSPDMLALLVSWAGIVCVQLQAYYAALILSATSLPEAMAGTVDAATVGPLRYAVISSLPPAALLLWLTRMRWRGTPLQRSMLRSVVVALAAAAGLLVLVKGLSIRTDAVALAVAAVVLTLPLAVVYLPAAAVADRLERRVWPEGAPPTPTAAPERRGGCLASFGWILAAAAVVLLVLRPELGAEAAVAVVVGSIAVLLGFAKLYKGLVLGVYGRPLDYGPVDAAALPWLEAEPLAERTAALEALGFERFEDRAPRFGEPADAPVTALVRVLIHAGDRMAALVHAVDAAQPSRRGVRVTLVTDLPGDLRVVATDAVADAVTVAFLDERSLFESLPGASLDALLERHRADRALARARGLEPVDENPALLLEREERVWRRRAERLRACWAIWLLGRLTDYGQPRACRWEGLLDRSG